MSLIRLRLSMVMTLAIIIGLSTLFFTAILLFFDVFNVLTIVFLTSVFNILQWLFAPYLVDALYRVREMDPTEYPSWHARIDQLSQKSGVSTPRLMVARIPLPNAFAYGSPLTGTRVAITEGMFQHLEAEEVEAVVAHELGHLRQHDVQVMMFLSVLPAILYYLSYSFYFSSTRRDRNRESNTALIGSVSMVLYFVLTLLSLRFSRLREYYADRHCVSVVEDGARKLSEALAKIVMYTSQMRWYGPRRQYSNFKTLFIADPDTTLHDAIQLQHVGTGMGDQQLVEDIVSREPGTFASLIELFSTHPNIVKRLRVLQDLATTR